MFQKVFEYAGPHKKGLYAATAIVLVSVLLGVFPFVLAYQVIAPLVMGEAITASFIIQHVILVLVCLVLQALFYGWGLNLSHKAAYDTLLRLRTALQKRFEKLPLGVIQDKGTGTVKKLFVDDVGHVVQNTEVVPVPIVDEGQLPVRVVLLSPLVGPERFRPVVPVVHGVGIHAVPQARSAVVDRGGAGGGGARARPPDRPAGG